MGASPVPLVGRADELGSFERMLDELGRGASGAVELVGGPGIGKTRLLAELAARAGRRGYLVLAGSASEFERDLPFSVFVDALDEYLEGLEPQRLAVLDEDVQAELAHVFPSLSALAHGREVAPQHERFRSHRAVRALLEVLAASTPLVLVLDDFHWADSASGELLSALLRRPPAGAVLVALAARPRQMSERLTGALERSRRDSLLVQLPLGALTFEEARELLGHTVDSRETAAALYEESGGNPFYLEQLARWFTPARSGALGSTEISSAMGVPPAVAAALGEELAHLPERTRRVLEGAAVAGDPFEPELAAAAAATSEAAAIEAVDELLHLDLVRVTDVPRRFRFRHPLLRRAIYDAAPGGWRLEAHERCARELAARGASPSARAHHIECSARDGDLAAVAALREAGEEAARLAPASAARWFGGALRLLPARTPAHHRVELLLARADALAATGEFVESHRVLLEGLAAVPNESIALHTSLTAACARAEDRLGRYDAGHRRLSHALDTLPDQPSRETVTLLIELALNAFYRADYESMHDWADRAVHASSSLGDAPLAAAALVMPAWADAMTGNGERGRARCAHAAAFVDRLSDDEFSCRLDAAEWLAASELYLDLYREADAHATRALGLARATGQAQLFLVLYQIIGRVWYVRGKLTEAAQLLDGAIEATRLLGATPVLAGMLFNRSDVAVATGDLDLALATARESFEIAHRFETGFVAGWAGVRLANALAAAGRPASAVEVLLGRGGGGELTLVPGGWRAYCFELLARSLLALGQREEAGHAVASASSVAETVRLPLATVWAGRAAAALGLYDGAAAEAAALALASAAGADEAGAPIEAALSRTLAGRALARAGDSDQGVAQLQRAAAELHTCGALHYRDEAERELGKLGQRPHRRTRPGSGDALGLSSLTERELQIARLVVDRRTNPEIAAALFLSQKTIETHLNNIFRKMDVSSRVALARAVEHPERATDPPRGT